MSPAADGIDPAAADGHPGAEDQNLELRVLLSSPPSADGSQFLFCF